MEDAVSDIAADLLMSMAALPDRGYPARYVVADGVGAGQVLQLSRDTWALNTVDVLKLPHVGWEPDSPDYSTLFGIPVVHLRTSADEEWLWSVDPDAAFALADRP